MCGKNKVSVCILSTKTKHHENTRLYIPTCHLLYIETAAYKIESLIRCVDTTLFSCLYIKGSVHPGFIASSL